MKAQLALLLLVATATLAPTASAEIIVVQSTYDPTGGPLSWYHNESDAYRRTISYQFNPDYFDTTTYTDNAIAHNSVDVEYTARTGGLLEDIKTDFSKYNHEFQTHTVLNGTVWINQTTTVNKPHCLFNVCTSLIEVCNSATLAVNDGTNAPATYEPNDTCYRRSDQTAPRTITHGFRYTSSQLGRPNLDATFNFLQRQRPGFSVFETTGGAWPMTSFTSGDVTATNLPKHVNTVTQTADAISQDTETIDVSYRFVNWNASIAEKGLSENNTEANAGTFEKLMATVFGAAKTTMSFLFSMFPGGAEAASFVSVLLTVLIGIPLFTVQMVILDPVGFFIVHTSVFACYGIVRWASSSLAEIGVIFTTALLPWKYAYVFIVAFAKWTYEATLKLVQICTENTVVLGIVSALAVGGGLLAYILHH